MKKSLGILLLLVSSGILLGAGGTYFIHLSTSTDNNDSSNKSRAAIETQRAEKVASVKVKEESTRDPISASTSQSVTAINDPALDKDSFQRKLTIYSYVAGLTERQVAKELLNSVDLAPELSRRVLVELQTALLERLATLNPTAAMNFVTEQKDLGRDYAAPNSWGLRQSDILETPTRPLRFVRSVFKEWALNDRDSAIRDAKSLKADVKSNALAGILASLTGEPLSTYRHIAKELGDEDQGLDFYLMSFSSKRIDDAKTIWDEIVTLVEPNDHNHLLALNNVMKQWFQQDGMSVLDQVRSSALNEDLRRSVVDSLLRLAAKENPHQAFQYALNMPRQGVYNQPLYNVVYQWALSDPRAAYQATTGIKQSGPRENLQRHVVSVWATNEPYYFLENLESFPPQMRDSGSASALQTIAQTSPQEAAEIALKHIEGSFGALSYVPTQILQHWIAQDAEAAIQWVVNGPVSEEKRHAWVSALATNLVDTDPRRAFDIAVKQPIAEGTYMPALEAQIIGQIVMQDFDLAVELLPRVREGTSRSQAYSSVGNKYINLGQSSEAVDLGLKLTANEQAQYFQTIVYTWATVDASGLVESFKSLPTTEIRSNLAQTLTSQWMKDNFTEGQLEVLSQYLSDSD